MEDSLEVSARRSSTRPPAREEKFSSSSKREAMLAAAVAVVAMVGVLLLLGRCVFWPLSLLHFTPVGPHRSVCCFVFRQLLVQRLFPAFSQFEFAESLANLKHTRYELNVNYLSWSIH